MRVSQLFGPIHRRVRVDRRAVRADSMMQCIINARPPKNEANPSLVLPPGCFGWEGPKACPGSTGGLATVVAIGSILLPAMVAQGPDDQRADPAGDDRLDQGQRHRLGRVPARVNLLLAGNVMEPSSIAPITAPIFFPIAVSFGINPVHLGILMTVNMEVGLCHPRSASISTSPPASRAWASPGSPLRPGPGSSPC